MANRIYFFEKRNPATSEGTGVIVDCEEKLAYNYHQNGRLFKYIGWSDGTHILEARKKMPSIKKIYEKDESGDIDEETRNILKQARLDEIEAARTNPDKTPPRNLHKMVFNNPAAGGGETRPMPPNISNQITR